MKKLAFFTLLPLLFAACSSAAPQESATSSADMILDNSIFDEAISSNDLERCEKISNQEQKTNCKDIVNANVITANAISKVDSDLCKDIVLDRYKEECEFLVQKAEESAKILEIEKDKQDKYTSVSGNAYEKQDLSLCDSMEDENYKFSCRFNIIANQALTSGDPSKCDEIGSPSHVENCKMLIGQP